MTLTNPVEKLFRFDFDEYAISEKFILDIEPSVGLCTEPLPVTLVCQWRIYSVDESGQEVLGYVRESEITVVEFDTPEKDMPALINFCSDSFNNVEVDFKQRFALSDNIFDKPPVSELGASLLESLVQADFYK